jgi:hypothetical protein
LRRAGRPGDFDCEPENGQWETYQQLDLIAPSQLYLDTDESEKCLKVYFFQIYYQGNLVSTVRRRLEELAPRPGAGVSKRAVAPGNLAPLCIPIE